MDTYTYIWIYMDIYINYYTYISHIIYTYRSCLQGYRGTFKDESNHTGCTAHILQWFDDKNLSTNHTSFHSRDSDA